MYDISDITVDTIIQAIYLKQLLERETLRKQDIELALQKTLKTLQKIEQIELPLYCKNILQKYLEDFKTNA